jgi:hypothetical protein
MHDGTRGLWNTLCVESEVRMAVSVKIVVFCASLDTQEPVACIFRIRKWRHTASHYKKEYAKASGNSSDLYSRGPRFQSRSERQVS